MKVEISNEIVIFEPTIEVINWVNNNLILDNLEYRTMKYLGKEDLIKWKKIPEKICLFYERFSSLILPFGCLRAIWPMIKDCDIHTTFNNAGDISIKNDSPTYELYDYQEEAVREMVKAKSGVLVSPAGSGKTTCGIEIIRRIGKKALWLCHTSDLLRQARDDMLAMYPNVKIGLTTEGKLEIGDDVTISTIQTLEKLDPDLYKNSFDVIIVDESAHVASSPTKMKMFGKILSKIPARYKYGLTATPKRSDGLIKSMYCYLGANLDGVMAPTFKVEKERVKTIPSFHKKIELNSGYDEEKIFELYDESGMLVYNNLITSLSENNERNDKIIENVIECNKYGRKQVVLTLRVSHCEELLRKLKEKGINAELITGKSNAKQREKVLKQQVKWDVIVSTYSLLKEGVSIKELDTLHMATPIKDKAMVVQCAGRIERYLPNKKQPIVFDYVDMDIPYCQKRYTDRRRALKSRF